MSGLKVLGLCWRCANGEKILFWNMVVEIGRKNGVSGFLLILPPFLSTLKGSSP